ncbi:hypothetical protein BGZ94_008489 [Podila epigama]|nr:hypothetical protein BGZ94_008489 [Podila epigama]
MPSERIISLLPSAAEIICLVGGGAELIARSHADDFPVEILDLPVLTSPITTFTTSADLDRQVSEAVSQGNSLYNLDADQLIALKPTVIVTQDLCKVCSIDLVSVQRLAVKINPSPKIVTLNPTSVAQVMESITTIGHAIGRVDEAAKARATLENRIDRCKRVVAEIKANASLKYQPKRVMFFEWTDPVYPGGHWTPEMIEMAGGVHPITAPAESSHRVTIESVVATDPQVLILCPCGLDIEATRKEYNLLIEKPWFQQLADRAISIVMADGNQMFNRSGPRLVDCLEFLVMLLQDRPDFEPPNFPWERIK